MILDLTENSAVHLGLVLAARTVPQFVFVLLGGVFADLFDRRKLIILSVACAALLDFILAVLLLTGVAELWHIYATTLLKGVATSFDQPSRQSILPLLVQRKDLPNAVGLNTASMNTMRIFGSSLSGFLVAFFGVGITFLIVSLLDSLAVQYSWRMRTPPTVTPIKGTSRRDAVGSFVEGMRYVWEMRLLRQLIALQLVFMGMATSYMSVFAPLLARQQLGIGDQGFGLMMSVVGVGSLAGALVVATLSPSRRRGKVLLVLVAFQGVILSSYAASTYFPYLAVTFVLFGLVGATQSSVTALGQTVVLQSSQPEKRGRVTGIMSLDRSMFSLGATAAGFVAAAFGAQMGQIGFGVALVGFAAVGAFLFADLRHVQ